MKKRAVILTCILSASILLSGSYILPLLNHIAEKETKTVKTYQTASQDEAETDSSEADAGDTEDTDSEKSSRIRQFSIRQRSCTNSIITMRRSNF